jgi:hypothetical protein
VDTWVALASAAAGEGGDDGGGGRASLAPTVLVHGGLDMVEVGACRTCAEVTWLVHPFSSRRRCWSGVTLVVGVGGCTCAC